MLTVLNGGGTVPYHQVTSVRCRYCNSDDRSNEYAISSSAPATNSFTSNRSNEYALRLVKLSNLEVYKLPIYASKTRTAV
jgi:hypothetical protein